MGSVLGSILDPAADKALMTTLVVTLTIRGLVPRTPSQLHKLQVHTPHLIPFGLLTPQYRSVLSFWEGTCY